MNTSNLTYPHTNINSTLKHIINNSDRFGADAQKALDDYRAKKAFYVARIAELESAQSTGAQSTASQSDEPMAYPHTSISENLDRLESSLQNSSSPERAARLALLAAVRTDYAKKRAWFEQFI